MSTSAAVWRDEGRSRDVPVRTYAPDDTGATAALPIVVFSHGIGEDRDSYEYLGRALAGAGFLAVHVTHAGTDRAVLEAGYRHLYRAVKDHENWVNRPLDVSFVLDRLAADPRADLQRVAVAGHSAGAFTAFAVAGMRPRQQQRTLRDERVKAIIPMSMPRMDGIAGGGAYDSIAIPVLNMTGTCDASLIYRTLPRHRRQPFDSTRARGHYLLTMRGVNHGTFSIESDPRHALIAGLTIAFVRAFLLDDAAARAWFDDGGSAVVSGTELTVERK